MDNGTPIMHVVAGPNGAGKSSMFPVSSYGIDYINIDDIAAVLNNTAGIKIDREWFLNHNLHELRPDAKLAANYKNIPGPVLNEAASIGEEFILKHINNKESFAIENTLKTRKIVDMAELANKNGFYTQMYYVGVESNEISEERIKARSESGKLNIPKDQVSITRDFSIYNLPYAMEKFHHTKIYDNSIKGAQIKEPVVKTSFGNINYQSQDSPAWIKLALYESKFDFDNSNHFSTPHHNQANNPEYEIIKQINLIKENPITKNPKIHMNAKDLYNAYCNDEIKKNNGVLDINKIDHSIAQALTNDGHRSLRVMEVLQQSPNMTGLNQEQSIVKAQQIIKSIEPSPTIKMTGPQR